MVVFLELIEIISKRNITPVFQPIVKLDTGTVVGFEAFARGPLSHLKSPKELFEEAARLGLLKELDVVCVTEALKQAPKGENRIFVNIHPSTLVWYVSSKKRLKELTMLCSPRFTTFEIIEVENAKDYLTTLIEAVNILQDIGYSIAIDDVSSGFNRLQLVAELNPDYIKIDRPLIAGCHKKDSLKSMLFFIQQMGDSIGSKIIAEGIEEKEELELLQELGIELGQGFLFASPLLDIVSKSSNSTKQKKYKKI